MLACYQMNPLLSSVTIIDECLYEYEYFLILMFRYLRAAFDQNQHFIGSAASHNFCCFCLPPSFSQRHRS